MWGIRRLLSETKRKKAPSLAADMALPLVVRDTGLFVWCQ